MTQSNTKHEMATIDQTRSVGLVRSSKTLRSGRTQSKNESVSLVVRVPDKSGEISAEQMSIIRFRYDVEGHAKRIANIEYNRGSAVKYSATDGDE